MSLFPIHGNNINRLSIKKILKNYNLMKTSLLFSLMNIIIFMIGQFKETLEKSFLASGYTIWI